MNKIIIDKDKYTFDATSRTITFNNEYEGIELNQLFIITNVTYNQIIYNFACEGYGGVINSLTLTLDYDTTLMSNLDELQIIIYQDISNGTIQTNELLLEIKRNTKMLSGINELLIIQNELIKQMF